MRQVNRLRRQDALQRDWNRNVCVWTGRLKLSYAPFNRLQLAGGTVKHGIDDLHEEGIFVLMSDHSVVAVQEILPCCLNRSFQLRDNLRILRLTVGHSLILKDYQEATGDRLP